MLAALSWRQRVLIIAVAVAVIGGMMAFSRWQRERDFKPLFTGMAAEDAGAVVLKLKESGTPFRLSDDGTSVLAPSARVAELRIEMASQGLPKSGRVGFELFDKTNFGATDFAEQVNFRRALEGEMERSIATISGVEQARVHLTFPKDSVFLEARAPAKASVLLRLRANAKLSQANVTGMRHLVASGVEGLSADAVAIMDVAGNLLSRPRSEEPNDISPESIEYRQSVERDLLSKINATLEPLLGVGKFRAGISVECDFTSGEQSEETFDPERSVMLTSQRTEESNGNVSSGGVPGTASNLPRPAARTPGTAAQVLRRTENVSYQTSKTVRRVKLPQGGVKRISTAVLLDQTLKWEGTGPNAKRLFTPPAADTLRAIRELVAAVIGFTPTRGDQLVIESLPFESTVQQTPPLDPAKPAPAAPPSARPLLVLWNQYRSDPRAWGGVAGFVLLLMVAAILLVRRKKKKRQPVLNPAISGDLDVPAPLAAAQENHSLEEPEEVPLVAPKAARIAAAERLDTQVKELREAIGDDSLMAARVLRRWLEEG